MQKDDNTGCSDHDAANMFVKTNGPTPAQRMRTVIQYKTTAKHPEFWNSSHNIFTCSIITTKNTLHLLRFKVLTMETRGAVYTGKSVLENWKVPATSTIRDDASLRILRNVGTHPLDYLTSHPRRQLSSKNIFFTKTSWLMQPGDVRCTFSEIIL